MSGGEGPATESNGPLATLRDNIPLMERFDEVSMGAGHQQIRTKAFFPHNNELHTPAEMQAASEPAAAELRRAEDGTRAARPSLPAGTAEAPRGEDAKSDGEAEAESLRR